MPHSLISVFISGLILLPLAYQYYLVRQEHSFIREIENSIPFSLDLIALPRYVLSSVLPENILNIFGMRPVDYQNYSDIAFSGFSAWMALFSCVIALKLLLPSDDVDTFVIRELDVSTHQLCLFPSIDGFDACSLHCNYW